MGPGAGSSRVIDSCKELRVAGKVGWEGWLVRLPGKVGDIHLVGLSF